MPGYESTIDAVTGESVVHPIDAFLHDVSRDR
jgi:hypothetical protein